MPPDRIVFQGKKYKLSGSYYRRNVWGSDGPSNLHRAIWEHVHGRIPDGCDIHHVDGDPFNNELANLCCVDRSEHQREHARERYEAGTLKPPGPVALERAAEWHRSTEGLEWHRAHGKSTWVTRKWVARNCNQRGQSYFTPYPTRSMFCHPRCKSDAVRSRRGGKVGLRPNRRKERVLSGKRASGQ